MHKSKSLSHADCTSERALLQMDSLDHRTQQGTAFDAICLLPARRLKLFYSHATQDLSSMQDYSGDPCNLPLPRSFWDTDTLYFSTWSIGLDCDGSSIELTTQPSQHFSLPLCYILGGWQFQCSRFNSVLPMRNISRFLL